MIFILTPNSDTFTNPTMVSLLGYLKEKGEDVVLFGPEQEPACPEEFGFLKFKKVRFKLSLKNPKHWKVQIQSYLKVRKAMGNGKGHTLLVVDPLGLV